MKTEARCLWKDMGFERLDDGSGLWRDELENGEEVVGGRR